MDLRAQLRALAAVALLCLLTAGNCDAGTPKSSSGGHDFAPPDPNLPHPHPTAWDNTPATGGDVPAAVQGPPVVNGDAGPQNDSHFVVYQLVFVAKRESGGHVEYTDQNGHTVGPIDVKASAKVKAGTSGGFSGAWEHIERAHLGIAMGFTWFPIPSDSWAMCTLIYNGSPVDYQIVQGGPCAVSYGLPGKLPTPRNPGPVK